MTADQKGKPLVPELLGTVVNGFMLVEFAFLEVYVVMLLRINALISLPPSPLSLLEGRGWRRL